MIRPILALHTVDRSGVECGSWNITGVDARQKAVIAGRETLRDDHRSTDEARFHPVTQYRSPGEAKIREWPQAVNNRGARLTYQIVRL